MWNQQSVTELATPDPFEVDQSIDLPLVEAAAVTASTSPTSPIVQPLTLTPQQQLTTQHRRASIVVLIPLVLLTVAVISLKIGISALIPIIGSLIRFTGSIWQSVSDTDRGTESIPIKYPPAVAA